MTVEIKPAYDYEEQIRELFLEYTEMTKKNKPEFEKYLGKQGFDEELKHLQEKYGMPKGRLYLALADGKPAGCIGLRRIDDKNCEMKRLYVRPQFRGQKIGRRLVETIIKVAREIGYQWMLLDTFPFLKSAILLYKKMGFYEVESYNNSPMEDLVYLKLDLVRSSSIHCQTPHPSNREYIDMEKEAGANEEGAVKK